MEKRLVIYCLVPAARARDLLGPLRRHFSDDPRVQVIVDRRVRERRARAAASNRPADLERRSGSDRRRTVLPRSLKPLPERLAAKAGAVRYVQRMLPLAGDLAQAELDAIVASVRAGDPLAPTELYWRMYERMHSRLSVLLGDVSEADMHVMPAFGRLLDALDDPDRLHVPLAELLEAAVEQGLERPQAEEKPQFVVTMAPSLAITDPELDEPVTVQDRDPRWFVRAMSERDRLLRLCGEHVEGVEHIGGTAVPAVAGRPVIDLMIGVAEMPGDDAVVRLLLGVGYIDCGDAGNPARRLLRRRTGARFDVHLVEHGGELWRDAIALREFLRRHPHEAHRWAAARREAARGTSWSYLAYAESRSPALSELLDKVRAAEQELPQDAGSPLPAA